MLVEPPVLLITTLPHFVVLPAAVLCCKSYRGMSVPLRRICRLPWGSAGAAISRVRQREAGRHERRARGHDPEDRLRRRILLREQPGGVRTSALLLSGPRAPGAADHLELLDGGARLLL